MTASPRTTQRRTLVRALKERRRVAVRAGNRAAVKALETRYKDETREAPIGAVYTTYALHRFALVAAQLSPEGTTLDEYEAPLAGSEVPAERKKFPTFVAFRVGVRQWSCVDREEG